MTNHRNPFDQKTSSGSELIKNKINVQNSQGLRYPSASPVHSTSKIPETLTTSYPSQEPPNSPSTKTIAAFSLSHSLSLSQNTHTHFSVFYFCYGTSEIFNKVDGIFKILIYLSSSFNNCHNDHCYFIYAHTSLLHHALLWIQFLLLYYSIHKNFSMLLWNI